MLVAAALTPWRETVARTDAALVLVLVVVAVAANGFRVAGLAAAASAALWFDVFLTQPYGRLTIADPADVETTVLLLLVGGAVTEIAVRARRLYAELHERIGYEAGIRDAAEALQETSSASASVDAVAAQLTDLLHLERCRFDYGTGVIGGHPRLRTDGEVLVDGQIWDVDAKGLPVGADIELLVSSRGTYRGRFLLRARSGGRPSRTSRLVAVALATQVADGLSLQST